MVSGFKNLEYEERLRRLGLTTLEKRRARGDLIETYKLLTGKEGIDYEQFFTLAGNEHGLRGHRLKLFVERSRLVMRQKFFSRRVVSEWNSLPSSVVESTSVNMFKNRLDRFLSNMGT